MLGEAASLSAALRKRVDSCIDDTVCDTEELAAVPH